MKLPLACFLSNGHAGYLLMLSRGKTTGRLFGPEKRFCPPLDAKHTLSHHHNIANIQNQVEDNFR